MDLSVIIVHYRTPQLAADAVAALRPALDRPHPRTDCLIVDNGSDAAGADTLRGLGVPILTVGRNLGYAGGVNLGMARTQAPLVIVMNADVLVRPGCLDALGEVLRRGAAAAGPRFSWDRAERLLLPPTERRDLASETLARLSARGPRWARLARRHWRRHAHRHWTARDTINSYALSGALLAIRRDAWNRIGPFDAAFQLYFEETDWLARLARHGLPACHVPSARAVHHYNRSARDEPAAADWFAASARRFADKHVGRTTAAWLRRLERRPRATDASRATDAPPPSPHTGNGHGSASVASTPLPAAPSIDLAPDARWIEIATGQAGYPAAAEPLDGTRGTWRLPDDVWQHLAAGRYMLRTIDAAGRERTAAAFTR
jgi:N-acetylglucosaminyl-diphospho-decaprenol L-rhamnosyltransferase